MTFLHECESMARRLRVEYPGSCIMGEVGGARMPLFEDEGDRVSFLQYNVLNPVRAAMVGLPEDYDCSSCRAAAELPRGSAFLHYAEESAP